MRPSFHPLPVHRVHIFDPERSQYPRGPHTTLGNGTFLFAIAKLDFYHPHRFKNLPCLLRTEVQACRLKLFLQRLVEQEGQ